MSRPAHVVHNFVFAAFLQGFSSALAKIVENFVPAHALPLAFTAFARAPQGIKDAFRIVDLIDGCRAFGAVASATAGMRRVSFKLLDAHLLFINVSQEPTGCFAVEADGRNERVVFL